MSKKLKDHRALIVDIVYKSKWPGHLSSAMSVLEIIDVLYSDIMVIDDEGLDSKNSDKLILSKGHAALALYVVLVEKGYLEKQELYKFNNYNSMLGSHPCRHKVPGVDVSTGSLGHGLPIGIGMAYANNLDNNDNVIYVILGDGEMNEGSIWESLLIASTKMDINICIIIDNNADIDNGSSYTPNLREKVKSFGWTVFECDGHDEEALKDNLKNARKGLNAIIAHTIKGKGFHTMEKNPEKWHYYSISENDHKMLIKELI